MHYKSGLNLAEYRLLVVCHFNQLTVSPEHHYKFVLPIQFAILQQGFAISNLNYLLVHAYVIQDQLVIQVFFAEIIP